MSQVRNVAVFVGSLRKESFNRKISLGVNFRDVDEQFGHSRSGTFVASFAF